ncbi:hypothetical protein [Methylomonas sp. MgM2]
MDLIEIVRDQEQRGIDALFCGEIEGVQWILGGNYLRIEYRASGGKVLDSHPHVNTLIKRLAQSNLCLKRQQDILHGCEHYAVLKYLECILQNAQISQIITDSVVNEEHLGF